MPHRVFLDLACRAFIYQPISITVHLYYLRSSHHEVWKRRLWYKEAKRDKAHQKENKRNCHQEFPFYFRFENCFSLYIPYIETLL